MTTIELIDLTRHYPRQSRAAVERVSLVVRPGELLALLGPSGSGKSTILKLIAGIERPDQGDIRFDQRSVLPVAPNQRGALLMFQKAYLFPFLNVADNIGFGLKVKGVNRQTIRAEVARMLDLVELPGIERRLPSQLSGGEQQRVALARALVTRPRVLMLDEPLSSLDTAVRHTLQEAIRRIQRELGITMLLVTHDLNEAVTMADRVALLLGGTVAACAPPEQIFQRPPTRAAARFMGITTFFEGHLAGPYLSTPAGQLAVVAGDGAGRAATFAIRPEHTRLLAAPGLNTLLATVCETIYKGEFTEFRVALNGERVHARIYQGCRHYRPGDQVYVQFPPEYLFEVDASA